MKKLLVLSLLMSATAFADDGKFIKCWETAQQEGGKPAYVFKTPFAQLPPPPATLNRSIGLVYPQDLYGEVEAYEGCLRRVSTDVIGTVDDQWFEACPTQGQRVRNLIPVDIDEREFEGTVYCEKELKKFFQNRGGGLLTGGSSGL